MEGLIKISKGNHINFQNVDYENQVSFKPLWEAWLTSCLNAPVWRDGGLEGQGKDESTHSTLRYDNNNNIFFSASVYYISMHYYSLIYNKKLKIKRG